MRLFGCPATIGVYRFLFKSPMNVVDLVAIVPYYIELPARIAVFNDEGGDAVGVPTFLRVARLVRVARILKVTKSMDGFKILLRTLAASFVPICMLLSFVGLLCFLFASLIYAFERGDWKTSDSHAPLGYWFGVDDAPTSFPSIFDGWYWCVQTLTSVGYGDIYPLSAIGKLVGSLAALGGLLVLALPITIIGANFDEEFEKTHRWEEFKTRSRVVAYNTASRSGTRKPPMLGFTWRFWRGRQPLPHASDSHFCDQTYNVQADLDVLLSEHYAQAREKFQGVLVRHSDMLSTRLKSEVARVAERAVAEKRRAHRMGEMMMVQKEEGAPAVAGSPKPRISSFFLAVGAAQAATAAAGAVRASGSDADGKPAGAPSAARRRGRRRPNPLPGLRRSAV